jgi:hypothetical protein
MDRKALVREYKNTPRPMGLYRVRNKLNGKAFIGTARDLPGILNSQRAQLRMGSHMNRELQRDWNALGPDAFAFELLDTLEPRDEPGYDPRADLLALEALWFDRLQPHGERGYHEPRGEG